MQGWKSEGKKVREPSKDSGNNSDFEWSYDYDSCKRISYRIALDQTQLQPSISACWWKWTTKSNQGCPNDSSCLFLLVHLLHPTSIYPSPQILDYFIFYNNINLGLIIYRQSRWSRTRPDFPWPAWYAWSDRFKGQSWLLLWRGATLPFGP